MGYLEYQGSKKVCAEIDNLTAGNEFYTLLMATMRVADTDNLLALSSAFPNTYHEFFKRFSAPGGKLEGEI